MNKNDGFVYFIQENNSNYFKVGATRAGVHQRLVSLQAATPHELIVRYVVGPLRSGEAWTLEGLLHDALSDKRIRGEWFRLPEIAGATGDCYVKTLVANVGFVPGIYAYAKVDMPGMQIPIELPISSENKRSAGAHACAVTISLTQETMNRLRAMAREDRRSIAGLARKLILESIF